MLKFMNAMITLFLIFLCIFLWIEGDKMVNEGKQLLKVAESMR